MQHSRARSHVLLRVMIVLALFVTLPALCIAQNRGGGGRGGGGGGNRGGGARGQQARPQQNRGARSNNPQNAGNNQRITITKTDGTAPVYELISFDVDHLEVRNPGERGEIIPIDVSWADVTKTSLPNVAYQKVLDQWKLAHIAELCKTCRGNRTLLCDVCRGTYHDPSELPKDCPTCAGALMTICKGPKCTNGMIPCTNVNCLKLTDGQWTEQDGVKARIFKYAGGTTRVTAAHLGKVVTVDPKTGMANIGNTCPVCGGTTVLECPVCDGAGLVSCQTCAVKRVALCSSDCDKGRIVCPDCGGTGIQRKPTPAATAMAARMQAVVAMNQEMKASTLAISSAGELMHAIAD